MRARKTASSQLSENQRTAVVGCKWCNLAVQPHCTGTPDHRGSGWASFVACVYSVTCAWRDRDQHHVECTGTRARPCSSINLPSARTPCISHTSGRDDHSIVVECSPRCHSQSRHSHRSGIGPCRMSCSVRACVQPCDHLHLCHAILAGGGHLSSPWCPLICARGVPGHSPLVCCSRMCC